MALIPWVSYGAKWATPADLFNVLDAEFGFTLDVCADADNFKCAAYFTEAKDGLRQEWRGVCWMNPPYGRGNVIGKWVKKARDAAAAGATVVCLLPASTDTIWFHNYCHDAEVRFIRGRLHFGDGPFRAPFGSMLVIFRPPSMLL